MIERRPWSCPRCGHFTTRPPDDDRPTHHCDVANATVALVAYTTSEQHAELLRNVATEHAKSRLNPV